MEYAKLCMSMRLANARYSADSVGLALWREPSVRDRDAREDASRGGAGRADEPVA